MSEGDEQGESPRSPEGGERAPATSGEAVPVVPLRGASRKHRFDKKVSTEKRALLFAALEAGDERSNRQLAVAFGLSNESTVRYLTKEWKKEKREKAKPQATVPVEVAHVLEVARVNGYAARLAELLMELAEELSSARTKKGVILSRVKIVAIGEALKIMLATRASVVVFAPGEGGMTQDVPIDVLEAVMKQLPPELSKKLMDALGAKVNVTVAP